MTKTCVTMCRIYCVLLLGLFVCCKGQSPCPDIFSYEFDGGDVHGAILLQPTQYVTRVHLRVNFTVAARLTSNYVGRVQPIGNHLLLQDFNRGIPINYRVDFPITSPIPRLTSIVFNDNIICYGPGDIPTPSRAVSFIALQHMLYLKSGSGNGPPNFINNQETRPKPETNNNIFGIFNSYDDKINSPDVDWNNSGDNNNYQIFIVNNTRPNTRPTQPTYEIFTAPTPRPSPVNVVPPTPTLPASRPSGFDCGRMEAGDDRVPLIFNGQKYNRGDWPWLVAIYRRNDGSLTFICAGTLVSDRHVITAAHCMQQKNRYTPQRDLVVKIGVYNLEDWGDAITVTRTLSSAVIHESYNASSLANDILLLTFDRSVEFNVYIKPACLWNGDVNLNNVVGRVGTVTGWGQSESAASGHGEPLMVKIPVVSTADCRASKLEFHKLTSDNTLCAGDRRGSGPCLGDSGGGLYLKSDGRWRLRGVVSLALRSESGETACNLNEYTVFTDTAKYLPWINDIMSQ